MVQSCQQGVVTEKGEEEENSAIKEEEGEGVKHLGIMVLGSSTHCESHK